MTGLWYLRAVHRWICRRNASTSTVAPASTVDLARAAVVVALAAVLLVGVVTAPRVPAQSLETREAELAAMREQIETLRGRLGSISSREETLSTRLAAVETELELQQMRLDEAVAAAALAAEKAADAERRIDELSASVAAVREDLRRRLAGLYRLGRQGYLRLFFAIGPDQELLPAIRQLRFLALRDRKAIERWTTLRQELAGQRERLEAQRRDMAAWAAEERQRRDELASTRSRHQDVLEAVARERRALAARTEELEDKERKLSRFVAALVDDESARLDGTPIQEFRGVLDWPAAGEVQVEYGPRRDPRYRTEVPHQGLDIETRQGDRVRTVFPGEVLYADDFDGYGPTVIVHHPGRVFTLYAGLSLLNVDRGDVLSLGDVIGAASGSLYFEIRIENEPENPRRWLR